jgi:hypothetical protein
MERRLFETLHKIRGVAAADPQGMVGVGIEEQSGTKWIFFWPTIIALFRTHSTFFP